MTKTTAFGLLTSILVLGLVPAAIAFGQEAESAARDPADWPRQRLVGLLRELADEVFDRFVVQDPNRRVFGMTYEYIRDGKQVQDFGLDTMHDGAWFMSALITAHRIDPEGGYLRRAQQFQVPFYVNVLTHSDRLFPHMVPREAVRIGFYDDGLAWSYRAECARAALAGKPMTPGFVAGAVGRVYCQVLATEAFYAPGPYRHGFTLDPRGAAFEEGTGRLARRYDGNGIMFARGMQYAWIAAAVLPHFKAEPQTWQAAMDRLAAEGAIARIQEGATALGVEFHVEPERVADYLDRYVVGTIDYWARVRKKLGYLPQGYFPDGRTSTWVRTAEMGAYAHLMKLVALRLMALDGVTELELIRDQAPAEPIPHQPLPDSVLGIQGLR